MLGRFLLSSWPEPAHQEGSPGDRSVPDAGPDQPSPYASELAFEVIVGGAQRLLSFSDWRYSGTDQAQTQRPLRVDSLVRILNNENSERSAPGENPSTLDGAAPRRKAELRTCPAGEVTF